VRSGVRFTKTDSPLELEDSRLKTVTGRLWQASREPLSLKGLTTQEMQKQRRPRERPPSSSEYCAD
jgi:hypothetical protein